MLAPFPARDFSYCFVIVKKLNFDAFVSGSGEVPSAIGLRAYCVRVFRKGEAKLLPLNDNPWREAVPEFFQAFFANHSSSATMNQEKERMWYFEELKRGNRGDSQGYIHYGTYGFEANFVDGKSRRKRFVRTPSDVEVIPLFYDLWFPVNSPFGLMAFQSFAGRSCKEIVSNRIRENFEARYPGYSLGFRKLMPAVDPKSPFGDAPVKNLLFKRRKMSSDDAENYMSGVDSWDLELSIKAERRGSLGKLFEIMQRLKKTDSGLVTFDGVDYEEALADVRIGSKIRRVGLSDAEGDFGVIDLTDKIEIAANGHPAPHSIIQEVRGILENFDHILRREEE